AECGHRQTASGYASNHLVLQPSGAGLYNVGAVAAALRSNAPVLSPNCGTSRTPIACSTLSITLAIGVPSAARRCRPPLSGPPARPRRNRGQRLWLCRLESPIGEP